MRHQCRHGLGHRAAVGLGAGAICLIAATACSSEVASTRATTSAAEVSAQPSSATTLQGLGALSIDLRVDDATVAVGERISFHAEITNAGLTAVQVGGGCSSLVPVSLWIGGEVATTDWAERQGEPLWDGRAESLTAHAVPSDPAWILGRAVDFGHLGRSSVPCPAIDTYQLIDPGESIVTEGAFDAFFGPGPIPAEVQLVAELQDLTYRPVATGSATITVVGSDLRAQGLPAFDADRIVDIAGLDERFGPGAGYLVRAGYRPGTWDLHISASGDQRTVKARVDAETGELVDLRIFFDGHTPGDDPNAADAIARGVEIQLVP